MLLDSNILIYGASGDYPALDEILENDDLAIASITRIETLGFHKLSPDHRIWLESAFRRIRIYPLDETVENFAVELRQKHNIGLADAIIAGTAMTHHRPLVTRNIDDFKAVPGLDLINPFD